MRRTVAAEMRLAATALHGLLGAPTAAAASYAVLECKHIQHDTLSGARKWRVRSSLLLHIRPHTQRNGLFAALDEF